MTLWSTFQNYKLKAWYKPRADNFVFQLHYRYTVLLLMVCGALTTLYDLIGCKIDCSVYKAGLDKSMVNTFCYIMGTYTVDHLHHENPGGPERPAFPGVGPHNPEEDPVTYHKFYQWVPFVLFLQAATFYLPHMLWKRAENSLFVTIIQDLSIKDYLKNHSKDDIRQKEFKALATYMTDMSHSYKGWAFKFISCEFLNVIVTVLNLYFTNTFLGGAFFEYGTKVLAMANMDPENRTDAMQETFPRMAKCDFKVYGPSGTIELKDIMCLLPTNIANEKIYLVLWFWLLALFAVGLFWVFVRVLYFIQPVRDFWFLFQFNTLPNKPSELRQKLATKQQIADVLQQSCLNDYMLLCQLGSNMESSVFREFLYFLFRHRIQKAADKSDHIPIIPREDMGSESPEGPSSLYPNPTMYAFHPVVTPALDQPDFGRVPTDSLKQTPHEFGMPAPNP